jgi:HK97 family phage prohead protease
MSAIELREAAGKRLILEGVASRGETWYPVGSRFEEKMCAGVWRRSLANGPDTVLLVDHNGLGFARTRTPSGEPSLHLSEQRDGSLGVKANLDLSSPRVQDLRATIENCGIQMSVGFICEQDRWDETGERLRREVIASSLHKGDVTLCNFGANPETEASVSERGDALTLERRDYEALKGTRERRFMPVEAMPRGRSQIAVPRDISDQALLRRTRINIERARRQLGSTGYKGKARRRK